MTCDKNSRIYTKDVFRWCCLHASLKNTSWMINHQSGRSTKRDLCSHYHLEPVWSIFLVSEILLPQRIEYKLDRKCQKNRKGFFWLWRYFCNNKAIKMSWKQPDVMHCYCKFCSANSFFPLIFKKVIKIDCVKRSVQGFCLFLPSFDAITTVVMIYRQKLKIILSKITFFDEITSQDDGRISEFRSNQCASSKIESNIVANVMKLLCFEWCSMKL